METPEKIYELVKAMPSAQMDEVLDFVEFLRQKAQVKAAPRQIPKGTLTGLRGIAKGVETSPTDEEIKEEYTNYLMHKYLDFRQAAGLGQEMWSQVAVENYIQQERESWD